MERSNEVTLTFLFTDVEGSTALVERRPDDHADLMSAQAALIRSAIDAHGGTAFGEAGDAVFACFPSPADAVSASVDAQVALREERWPDGEHIAVRMGVHTGTVKRVGEELHGLALHEVARICAAAHGGQVLISETTRALLASSPPAGVTVRDLGVHTLKDLAPQRLFQLEEEKLRLTFPPPRSIGRMVNNLPARTASFVGRVEQVDRITQRVAVERLLTLLGPGGVGKTTLAIRVAAEVADSFPGGTWFVDLSVISADALVPRTIAAALRAVDREQQDELAAAAAAIGSARTLVLLDNCEQVLEGASDAANAFLQACPGVTIIATSRHPLELNQEAVEPVAPLAVQPPGPDEISDAARLFVERARASRSDFLPAGKEHVINQLCDALDGLPLAIELAAPRVTVLSVEQILERATQGTGWLVSRTRDGADRHRTLTGTIDWSYRLLTEEQQRVFRYLSVFAAPFDLKAAEAVSGGPDTLAAIEDLTRASLVGSSVTASTSRFWLLDTIRAFAADRMTSEETESARVRLIQHFVEWAGRDPTSLQEDLDNAWGALWLCEEPDPRVRLASALARHARNRHEAQTCAHMIERSLPLLGDEDLRLAALMVHASAVTGWDPNAALDGYARAMSLYQARGDPAGVARCHMGLARVAWHGASYEQAEREYDLALTLYRELADREAQASVLRAIGNARKHQGDFPGARALFAEALHAYKEVGRAQGIALVTLELAYTAWAEGDLAASRELFDEALGAWHRMGADPTTVELNLAMLEVSEGAFTAAASSCRAILMRTGDSLSSWATACTLAYLAWAEEGRGNPALAARLIGSSDALMHRIGARIPGAEEPTHAAVTRRLRDTLGEERFAVAVAAGAAMGLQEAVAHALSAPVEGATEGQRRPSPPSFVRDAEGWRVRFAGLTASLRDTKGMGYIAALLRAQGSEVHVTDLVGGHTATEQRPDGGPLLDIRARAQIKERLADLEQELEEARQWNDSARVERAEAELAALRREIASATGLRGRSRRIDDQVERMRKSAGNRISDAIKRIAKAHPALAQHLSNSIRTGRYCSYQPEQAVTWSFEADEPAS